MIHLLTAVQRLGQHAAVESDYKYAEDHGDTVEYGPGQQIHKGEGGGSTGRDQVGALLAGLLLQIIPVIRLG